MRLLAFSVILLLCWTPGEAQSNKAFTKAMAQLRAFAKKDSVRVQRAVNRWWEDRKKNDQVPLTSTDSAAFFYRGPANSVMWAGDFNGWGSKPSPNRGVRIKNTDIWVSPCAFPSAARFDYKIILNEKDWILDPVNPHQQFSGLGGGSPNSELRMAGWKRDACQVERTGIVKGSVEEKKLTSQLLGYDIAYIIYTPAGNTSTNLPVLYVTDGNEYIDPRLGSMRTVLDNLIADGLIKPIRVVFIDARDPKDLTLNRRMTELSLNETFLKFLTEELITAVEGSQPIERNDRGILGTSLGGLSAAYFAFKRPDLFGLAGIQSPAFWYKPEIFTLAEQTGSPKLKTFLSAGTYFDAAKESQKMKLILEQRGHSCHYIEVPEAHSWGNWRNLLDDMLQTLYSKP